MSFLDDNLVRELGAEQARARLGDWLYVYNACFASAPWDQPKIDLSEYERRVSWHFEQVDFRALEMTDGHENVVAVAYGWPAPTPPPDQRFYRLFADSLGPERTRQVWRARPFEVVDLMVAPQMRRQGLARHLLSKLCPNNGVSILATHPDAPAAEVYRRLGWQHLGSSNANAGSPMLYLTLDPLNQLLENEALRGQSSP